MTRPRSKPILMSAQYLLSIQFRSGRSILTCIWQNTSRFRNAWVGNSAFILVFSWFCSCISSAQLSVRLRWLWDNYVRLVVSCMASNLLNTRQSVLKAHAYYLQLQTPLPPEASSIRWLAPLTVKFGKTHHSVSSDGAGWCSDDVSDRHPTRILARLTGTLTVVLSLSLGEYPEIYHGSPLHSYYLLTICDHLPISSDVCDQST
jgi:hypothetical protein